MERKQSTFSIVLVAIAVLLTLLAIIVVFTTPAFGQDVDPCKAAAAQPPSIADAPLKFQVVSQRQMINESYQSRTLLTASVAYAAVSQANQYTRDGLSFSYPSAWILADESDAQAQSLNLGRGSNEAKIIVVVLRRQMTAAELAETQPKLTQAISDTLAQEITKLGAQVQRTPVSQSIGGVQAQGIKLRASISGETGDADIYWLALGGRSVHVIFVGSDPERARAAYVWNMVCSTMRVGTSAVAPSTRSTTPGDLNSYAYRRITDKRVELYMDEWGRGYVHDRNNEAWVRIPDYSGRRPHHATPQNITIQIHPSFCKTSDTMALIYAFGGLLVYDSSLYTAQNPNEAWRLNYEVSQRGQVFASISRSAVVSYIAQANDMLALAAGINWICVYDLNLHRWVNYRAAVDDSTSELNRNLVLRGNGAGVRVLNGPFCSYSLGSGSWNCASAN